MLPNRYIQSSYKDPCCEFLKKSLLLTLLLPNSFCNSSYSYGITDGCEDVCVRRGMNYGATRYLYDKEIPAVNS